MDIHTIGRCPLCGGRELYEFAYCTDYEISGENYSLLRCKDCGMVTTANAPMESETHRYERLQHKLSLAESPKGVVNTLYYIVREIMLNRKWRMVKQLSYQKRGTLLNYGAKTGFFSDYMVRKNWAVTSVEKFHQERQFALELFHHRMIDTPDMRHLKDSSFDVVTLWHVLEHNNHPDELLNSFHKILKPNGILMVAMPNVNSLDAQYYGSSWAAYNVPRHLWHFNPNTISMLAKSCGFVLMDKRGLPFDAFYISILSERRRGKRCALLKGAFKGLRFWVNSIDRTDNSSSIVYTFRKLSN